MSDDPQEEKMMGAKKTKYFSVAVEDKAGELARFTRKLKEMNINLAGVWGFGTGSGKAQILAVPQDPEAFQRAAGAAGWEVKAGTCYRVEGEDRAGALVDTLERVAKQGINLHAVDAVAQGGRYAAYFWAQEKDEEKLGKVLVG